MLLNKVGEYYRRDEETPSVSPDVLIAQLRETIRSDKQVESLSDFLNKAMSEELSETNVRTAVLLAKQQEIGDKLAQALVSGVTTGGDTIGSLMEEYAKVSEATDLDELEEQGLRTHQTVSVLDLVTKEYDPTSTIKTYPPALYGRLDGGAMKGHHIVVYGRPESGKTAAAITLSCGFLYQGFKVLYFINEDRDESIILRHVYNLSNMDKFQVRDNPQQAQERAIGRGFNNLVVIGCSPGTPAQIVEEIERHQPDCIIVDQLRNLKVRADNRVNQLEHAATEIRTIAKKYNVLAVSVTQAGDSAEGKAVLDMGDVDYSNTGIPAQADVMIGIGVDAVLEAESRRMYSLPKNKISGNHQHFPVNILPQFSRITDV